MSAPGEETAPPRRRPLLVLVPLVLFLALAGLFLARLHAGRDTSEVPSALIGKAVPPFELPPLAGLTEAGRPVPGLASGDLQGRVTVVNVWASWCVPCRQEHPLLERLGTDDRIRVVGINYKDEPENALRFLGQLGNPFAAVGTDKRGRVAIDWGVYGVPETFVVAPDGTIAYKYIGPIDEDGLRDRLLPAIRKAAEGRP